MIKLIIFLPISKEMSVFRNKIKLISNLMLILVFTYLIFVINTNTYAQLADLTNIEMENTIKDNRIYDLSMQKNMNMQNSMNQDYQITKNYSNIGKNISEHTLSLELKSLDVAYDLQDKKIFSLVVKNLSQEDFNIVLADNLVHNIFFDVYDEIHLPVTIPSSLMVERNSDYIKSRNINLAPNELLTLSINIDDYVTIKDTGVYKISARFYPDMFVDVSSKEFDKSKYQPYVMSNTLLVSVMESENFNKEFNVLENNFLDIYNNKKLITREYSPYDVISAALESLKNRDWETFFSFVDINALYTNTYDDSENFKYMKMEEKQMELNQFMKRIKTGSEINDINYPSHYTISNTQFTKYDAEVQVITEVPSNFSVLQYSYTFFLKNSQKGWKITNYQVKYIGIISNDAKAEFLGTNNEFISPFE